MAPTLDSAGRAGFEATASVGIGWPLDFSGRSQHFVQGRGIAGGGRDGASGAAMAVDGAALDYIYRTGGAFDLRAGASVIARQLSTSGRTTVLYGAEGHVTLLPIVAGSDANWMIVHFSLGPELSLAYLWSDPGGAERLLLAVPLVAELNFLAAGD